MDKRATFFLGSLTVKVVIVTTGPAVSVNVIDANQKTGSVTIPGDSCVTTSMKIETCPNCDFA